VSATATRAVAANAHWCAAVGPPPVHGAASVLHSSTDPRGAARPQLQQPPGVGRPSRRVARAPAAGLLELAPVRVRHLNAWLFCFERDSRPTAVHWQRHVAHTEQRGGRSQSDQNGQRQGTKGTLHNATEAAPTPSPTSLSSAVRPCIPHAAVSVRPDRPHAAAPSPVPFHLSST
jgi:hypothetical protein